MVNISLYGDEKVRLEIVNYLWSLFTDEKEKGNYDGRLLIDSGVKNEELDTYDDFEFVIRINGDDENDYDAGIRYEALKDKNLIDVHVGIFSTAEDGDNFIETCSKKFEFNKYPNTVSVAMVFDNFMNIVKRDSDNKPVYDLDILKINSRKFQARAIFKYINIIKNNKGDLNAIRESINNQLTYDSADGLVMVLV